MNLAERWEVIEERKTTALLIANQKIASSKELIQQLKAGVDISVANHIITEMWADDQYARRIKTQLSSQFPKENGELLIYARLGPADLERWFSEKEQITAYFDACHGFINDMVAHVTAKLANSTADDETKQLAYNGFRRECLTFIHYLADWSYDARNSITDGNCNSWTELTEATPLPMSVENGDYLFIDDFIPTLKKIQAEYVSHLTNYGDRTKWSIDELQWVGEKIVPQIAIQYLFAQYLTKLCEM